MSKKKVIILLFCLFLLLPVFKDEKNNSYSILCRDNPEGSSYGLIAFGFIFARDNIISFFNFSSCQAGKSIISLAGIPVGIAGESLASMIGVPIGNAGCDIFSFVGVPIGSAGNDIGVVVGISIGDAKRDLISFLGISIGNGDSERGSNGLFSLRFGGYGKPPFITGFWDGYHNNN